MKRHVQVVFIEGGRLNYVSLSGGCGTDTGRLDG